MNLDLSGKTALVTASSGGIGLAIARSLAAEGAKVIINGRTQDSVNHALAELRRDLPGAALEIGGPITEMPQDVRDRLDVARC